MLKYGVPPSDFTRSGSMVVAVLLLQFPYQTK